MSNITVGTLTFSLSYQPPYDWERVLRFFEGRAISGVELVKNGEYMRTVRMENGKGNILTGWLCVSDNPKTSALKVTLSKSLLPVQRKIENQIRRFFDLDCDPNAVYENLLSMNNIKPNLCVKGTRVPGCFNAFEMAVRAVLGQQITVKAASTLANRLAKAYGTPVNTQIEELTHTFPTPEDTIAMGNDLQNNLGKLGIISARSHTILELAKIITNNEIDFNTTHPEQEMKKLLKIKGIGIWTANYIAMRAMNWSDAFLETDYGVKCALQGYTAKELVQMAEAWRPYRSYAVLNLWNSLYLK